MPQTFKGSLSNIEAAEAMAKGIRRVSPHANIVLLPIADGGDGTIQALLGIPSSREKSANKFFETVVIGPLGTPVKATWATNNHLAFAIIEMAKASGLALISQNQRDPLNTTTYGTGQLILAALDAGYRKIIVGLGGSATNDGGVGMAQALGVKFLDSSGHNLTFGGANLASIKTIDLRDIDPRLKDTQLIGAADVMNPLCGPEGASKIYGPQKGASKKMAIQLDEALEHYANLIYQQTDINVLTMPGAGAAGGTGAGLVALLGGELIPGADLIFDIIDVNNHLIKADLVFTGEGKLDHQTLYNKAPLVIAKRAKKLRVPVIAVVGSLGNGYEDILKLGITAIESTTRHLEPRKTYVPDVSESLSTAAERAMRKYLMQKCL